MNRPKIPDDLSIADGKGIECKFYRLEDGRGFKVFDTKHNAKQSRQLQHFFSKLKMGPKVLSPVLKVPAYGWYDYGYYTEVAEKIPQEHRRMWMTEETRNCVSILQDKLKAIGFQDGYYDDHCNNFGIINGRFVIIDFGEKSFGPEYPIRTIGKRRRTNGSSSRKNKI